MLAKLYAPNDSSVQTNTFRAFKNDALSPPLGVQLTVKGSVWKFRDVLLQNKQYRIEYDNLKKTFEGKAMDAYRGAKHDFFHKL